MWNDDDQDDCDEAAAREFQDRIDRLRRAMSQFGRAISTIAFELEDTAEAMLRQVGMDDHAANAVRWREAGSVARDELVRCSFMRGPEDV
jgi:uncharacterized protein YukE